MGNEDLVGNGRLAPPDAVLARLAAALVASMLLHAGLLGSIERLIGGAAQQVSAARPAAGLRARIALPLLEPQLLAEPRTEGAPAGRKASELAAAEALPLLPGPRYFSAAELDQRPSALTEIRLDYPAGSKPRDGQVVARILINESGEADEVKILSSELAGQFDQLVIEAFAAAQYRPGKRNGLPVKSQMTVEVQFAPEIEPDEFLREGSLAQPAPADTR